MSEPFSLLRSCLAAMVVAAVSSAQANDLNLVAPNAVKESVAGIAARFEKNTGPRVSFTWGGSEAIAKRVAEGEVFDVVVTPPQVWTEWLPTATWSVAAALTFPGLPWQWRCVQDCRARCVQRRRAQGDLT